MEIQIYGIFIANAAVEKYNDFKSAILLT